MEVCILSGRDLDSGLLRTWRGLQAANPALNSPLFAPEYTQSVASANDGVEVAVLSEAGAVEAIFPFQRVNGCSGIPVGRFLSDFQGIICHQDFSVPPNELLRKCRLSEWSFDHLLVSQACFSAYHEHCIVSPQMDLSRGYEAYVAARLASGSDLVKDIARQSRRIEREIGPLRFVANDPNPEHLRKLFAWKSSQYIESGKTDILSLDWVRAVLDQIQATQTETFAGIASYLFAGDRLIAGHFGMRSQSTWHWYLPSYDKTLGKYSPGLILLLKVAEFAPSLGIQLIDLGAGMNLYKERLMNGSVSIAEGKLESVSLGSLSRIARRRLKAAIADTRFDQPVRRLAGWMRGKCSSPLL